MTQVPLYPLQFHPLLRRLIWGGRRLGTLLGKPIGEGSDYAESWEISDYRDWTSVVSQGPLAGVTLRELVQTRGEEILGPRLAGLGWFPLLVKFIDAREVLSVQVHPSDEQAARLSGDRGKTEAWVVMHAEPGSLIYAGLRPGVGPADLKEAVARGSVAPLLHAFEPRAGDCILIEAGTVHAIGAGVVLAEIQQTSDATYRIDDWGRKGPDGRPRPLHLDQALQVIDFSRGPVDPLVPHAVPRDFGSIEMLAQSRYFAFERLSLKATACVGSHHGFTILIGLGGRSCVIHNERDLLLGYGSTMLLPAALGPVSIKPLDGESLVLTCIVP
jgi:mannose-6-phosphate isomerase